MNVGWAISIVLVAMFALIAVGHDCCLVRFLVKGPTSRWFLFWEAFLEAQGSSWLRTRPCDTFGGYLPFLIMVLFRA